MFTGFNDMKVINELNECYLLGKRGLKTRQIRLKKVGDEDPECTLLTLLRSLAADERRNHWELAAGDMWMIGIFFFFTF